MLSNSRNKTLKSSVCLAMFCERYHSSGCTSVTSSIRIFHLPFIFFPGICHFRIVWFLFIRLTGEYLFVCVWTTTSNRKWTVHSRTSRMKLLLSFYWNSNLFCIIRWRSAVLKRAPWGKIAWNACRSRNSTSEWCTKILFSNVLFILIVFSKIFSRTKTYLYRRI